MEFIETLLAILISSGTLGAIVAVVVKRLEKRSAKRVEASKQESRLTMRVVLANTKVCTATAKALKGGHCNGEMTAALNESDAAVAALQGFLIHQTTEYIGGD